MPKKAGSSSVKRQATNQDAPLAVVGGGIVGLAFALAAAQRGLLVNLFAFGLAPAEDSSATQSYEQRVYALSPSSRAFLSDLRIWPELDHRCVCAVHDMHIFSGAEGNSGLHLSAYQAGIDALAFIVGHQALTRTLSAAVRFHKNIQVIDAEVTGVEFTEDCATIVCGSARHRAELVVGADGIDSLVRQSAGLQSIRGAFGATGVVANFSCSRGARNCATQWFTDQGVVALLPLSTDAVSLVWSAPDEVAAQILGDGVQAMAERLEAYGKPWYGALEPLGELSAFPLHRLSVPQCVAERVALIGDAAHVIHPLAGQGLNLGLDDAQALANLLESKEFYRGLGEQRLLRRYERSRREAVLVMGSATDALHWLYAGRAPVFAALAGPAMRLLDRLGPLKGTLVRGATHNGVPQFLLKENQ